MPSWLIMMGIKKRGGIKRYSTGMTMMTMMMIMKEEKKEGGIKKDPEMTPSIMQKNT